MLPHRSACDRGSRPCCADLLSKDYKVGKTTVEVKSKTPSGVTFTPLATSVACLAFCASRNLLVVGSSSGAVQLYSLSARGAASSSVSCHARGAASSCATRARCTRGGAASSCAQTSATWRSKAATRDLE